MCTGFFERLAAQPLTPRGRRGRRSNASRQVAQPSSGGRTQSFAEGIRGRAGIWRGPPPSLSYRTHHTMWHGGPFQPRTTVPRISLTQDGRQAGRCGSLQCGGSRVAGRTKCLQSTDSTAPLIDSFRRFLLQIRVQIRDTLLESERSASVRAMLSHQQSRQTPAAPAYASVKSHNYSYNISIY